MYFCKKTNSPMVENLTDAEILQGLKQYDEKVTSEFFYDTCHIAYCIDDKKYGLRYKTGMDFFSLAHEFYLRLCNHNWQQLENRKSNISLANWTINGFHYLVRERLKSYSQGNVEESIEERAAQGKVVFDAPVDDTQEEVKEMVEEICHAYYGYDRKAQSILRMILIMGMKGKEVAALMGITPAAVSQRYHTMMEQVVRPYFIKYYTQPALSPSMNRITMEEVALPKHMSQSCSNMEEIRKGKKSSGGSVWGKISEWLAGEHKSQEASFVEETPKISYDHRITPTVIHTLRHNEVFVFGSDLRGLHCGGTAYQALRSFGAQLGKGVGPQGQCYAIPTIVGGLRHIQPYVNDFRQYVSAHPQQTFLVTPVGCGLAGFTPKDIAPMFAWARNQENVYLPKEFWNTILVFG